MKNTFLTIVVALSSHVAIAQDYPPHSPYLFDRPADRTRIAQSQGRFGMGPFPLQQAPPGRAVPMHDWNANKHYGLQYGGQPQNGYFSFGRIMPIVGPVVSVFGYMTGSYDQQLRSVTHRPCQLIQTELHGLQPSC